jgi:hypothetical protein
MRQTTIPGLGGMLLAPDSDETHLVAVARWRSKADLEAFWGNPGGDGFERAELVSARCSTKSTT